jgi:hypothetical protein
MSPAAASGRLVAFAADPLDISLMVFAFPPGLDHLGA